MGKLVELSHGWTVTAPQAASAHCWITGNNQAVVTAAAGPGLSVAYDRMRIHDYVITIHRAGVLAPGIQAALCALTGLRGTQWLRTLRVAVQSRGERLQLDRPAISLYGVCLVTAGAALVADDIISVRLCYESFT